MGGLHSSAKAQRQALEATYEDWLEVWRPEPYKEGAITKTRPVQVAGSACALSLAGGGAGEQTSSFNLVEYGAKLFAPPEIDIKAGDSLQVVRCGKRYAFEPVGEPAPYPTHQEVFLKVREKA